MGKQRQTIETNRHDGRAYHGRNWTRARAWVNVVNLMDDIGILHGYLLDGSGSNLWTQSIVRSFCRAGARVLQQVVEENELSAVLANHAVLMSVVAQRVGRRCNLPYAIVPHGSAIEYAVKKDERFRRMAREAFG